MRAHGGSYLPPPSPIFGAMNRKSHMLDMQLLEKETNAREGKVTMSVKLGSVWLSVIHTGPRNEHRKTH